MKKAKAKTYSQVRVGQLYLKQNQTEGDYLYLALKSVLFCEKPDTKNALKKLKEM